MPRRNRCVLPGLPCHITQPGIDRRAALPNWTKIIDSNHPDAASSLRRRTYSGRPFGNEAFVDEMSRRFGRYWTRGRPPKERTARGGALQHISARSSPSDFGKSRSSGCPLFSPGIGADSSIDRIGGGVASGGGPVVIQLDGPATTALLRGEAVQTIASNPRVVATASMSAARSNAGRRELAISSSVRG